MRFKPRLSRERKHTLIYQASRLVYGVGSALPRPLGLSVFGALGGIGYSIPSKERQKTIDHLRSVYGTSWDEPRIEATARAVFVNLGRNLFDAIYFAGGRDIRFDRLVRCDDLTPFRRAYEGGKGVIVITAHLGCFEMLLPYFGHMGFRSFAIGRQLYDPRLDKLIANARQSGMNTEYLHRSENPRVILRHLSAGKTMGVLIDQDTQADGVFAHFLGRLAFTPTGPVKIALRYGIPAFVVTTARQIDGSHRIFIEGPLEPVKAPGFEQSLVRTVEWVNSRISSRIEQYPDQWVWMHNRWKHQPQSKGYEQIPRIDQLEIDCSSCTETK